VQFHDFKKQGVPEAALTRWLAAAGWEKLLNRQGATWRKLDAATPRNLVVQQPGNASGVPATATAVVANVTVTGGSHGSFVSVWPSGLSQPNVSNPTSLARPSRTSPS
jgi:hypothetical protein